MKRMEIMIERGLFASRWLMAPFYVGLVGALLVLLFSFVAELWHFISSIPNITADHAVLGVLSLIDLSLAGNLLLIVIFSGYENFVSKMDVANHEDKPEWQGTVDFATLKLKLIASIVAISEFIFSSIHGHGEGVRPPYHVDGDYSRSVCGIGRAFSADGQNRHEQQSDEIASINP